MSEMSERAREAMKAKARSMAHGDPHKRVDGSDWTPTEPLNANIKTGLRPLSRKRGGMVDGEAAKVNAGRKPRAAGGRLADEIANTNMKAANEEREGIKHDGGMKRGGRSHKADGGPLAGPISEGIGVPGRMNFSYPGARSLPQQLGIKRGGKVKRAEGGRTHPDEAEDKRLIKDTVKPTAIKGHPEGCKCGKCSGGTVMAKGGRMSSDWSASNRGGYVPKADGGAVGRKHGGRSGKGKMNVNIIIGQPHQQQAAPPPMMPPGGPPPMPPRPPMPMPPPMGATPPGMPPGMPPGAGMLPPGMMPPGGPPMMPRKRGGRAKYEAGAGSGLGRLEKVEKYGGEARKLDGAY